MILGNSALAGSSLGGDGGPETPPVATIALVGKAPMDDVNCPTAGISLSAPIGNYASNLWKPDWYPTPAEILLTAPKIREVVATASPAAAIALAGRIGTPVALNRPPVAAITLTGLVPASVAITAAPTAGLAFSALVGSSFVGTMPAAVTLTLAGLLPASPALDAIPAATISLVGLAPSVVVATAGTVASVSLSGALPTPAVLLRAGVGQIWLSAFPLIEAATGGTGKVVVLNANTLAVSEYGIAALDVVAHEGELYFVTATGLSKLAADGTEQFLWSFSTGELELVDESFGTVTKLAFSGRSDGEIRLTVAAKEYGEETEAFYSLPCESTTQSRGQHVLLARDVHAETWAFKFAGTAAVEVDAAAVLLAANKRAW